MEFAQNSLVKEMMADFQPARLVSQKIVKCNKFAKESGIPMCYTENSPKEELVLEHVKDYERQFKLVYKEHASRHLLLYPLNECQLEKFICTTMRPTQLPFLELYNWRECSEFIANFLQYEELNPPNHYPQIIPSPTNTLQWQYGDSFDFAITLASILIGAGYDAYVVHGRAPKEITSRDLTRTRCPLEIKEAEMGEVTELPAQNEEEQFEIPIKPPLISEFLRDRSKAEIEAQRRREFLEKTIDDDAPDVVQPDQWKGQRLHCWVLVMEGKRSVDESFFIEPTTGRTFSLTESLYENVEFVWNEKNFWIHMFPQKPTEEVNFDLTSGEDWEFVMLQTARAETGKKKKNDEGAEGLADDEQVGIEEMGTDGYYRQIEHVLDMPPPWPPKMFIDRDIFAQKCPMGEKTVFYERCKVDYYAEYSQYDGLVLRLTYYADYKRHIAKEIRWVYARRSDMLVMRRRFPLEQKTVEDYAPGHQYSWKQIVEVDSRSRLIVYYPTRHADGLIRREEEFETKVKEYFEDRDDYLVYRSWSFEHNSEPSSRFYNIRDEMVITKMTQKFNKDPRLPRGQKKEKVVYDMKKKKVTVYYHYESGSIRRQVVEFNREDFSGLGKGAEGQEEVDPAYEQKLQHLHELEKACHSSIKALDNNLKQESDDYKKQAEEWAKIRKEKENSAKLALEKKLINKTTYDKAREKSKELDKEKEEEKVSENTAIDYLAPVLRKHNLENRTLNKKEAEMVNKEVMDAYKERLLQRAEIIKLSLDKEKKALQDEIVSVI